MTAAFLLISALALSQPAAPFKIVVLAGEDSVNVIQQKTAVAPLVEVRDRNNNPVSGAVVTFAVQGGKAAVFQGGAATMTVATNAVGQAAAAGLTPMTAGAVNISVSAAVQGQVVTAAITQVNVMTAAEAAAAAAGAGGAGAGGGASGSATGAATGGGAAGGGGGLSATTIAVVGGVAAAGAVAATQLTGGSSDFYKSAFAIDITATFGSCARQERYGGDLIVEIEPHDSGAALTGNAEIKDAYWDVLATTCTGPIRPGRQGGWGMPNAPVTGNDASLSFQASDSVPAGDGSGPIARYYKFNGSLSGSTIVGTFELSWTGTIGGFVGRQNLTLTKQ